MNAKEFEKSLREKTVRQLQTHRVRALAERATTVVNSLGLAMTNLEVKADSVSGGVLVSWMVESSEYRVPFQFRVGVRVAETAPTEARTDFSPVEKIAIDTLAESGMRLMPIVWHSKKGDNRAVTDLDIIIATDEELTAWLNLDK